MKILYNTKFFLSIILAAFLLVSCETKDQPTDWSKPIPNDSPVKCIKAPCPPDLPTNDNVNKQRKNKDFKAL